MAQMIPLTTQEAANSSFTHQLIVTAADVAAMTSATAVPIYPAYGQAIGLTKPHIVGNVAMYVKTAFNAFQSDGTTAVTLTLSVGDANSATVFTAAADLTTSASIINANTTMKIPATNIRITPTFGASGDPTKTSVGELRIFLQIVSLPLLAK